jgi:hypothetical protein
MAGSALQLAVPVKPQYAADRPRRRKLPIARRQIARILERDRVVVPQVGAGKAFTRHPIPATSHRKRLPPVYHLAEGNRPVMAAQAQQRRACRLPRLGDGRRTRVRYVGCRRIGPIP